LPRGSRGVYTLACARALSPGGSRRFRFGPGVHNLGESNSEED